MNNANGSKIDVSISEHIGPMRLIPARNVHIETIFTGVTLSTVHSSVHYTIQASTDSVYTRIGGNRSAFRLGAKHEWYTNCVRLSRIAVINNIEKIHFCFFAAVIFVLLPQSDKQYNPFDWRQRYRRQIWNMWKLPMKNVKGKSYNFYSFFFCHDNGYSHLPLLATEYEITSLIGQLIHDVSLVADPSGRAFGQWADAPLAWRADQPVAADDVYDIYMLNYADTCPENSVNVFDKFCSVRYSRFTMCVFSIAIEKEN